MARGAGGPRSGGWRRWLHRAMVALLVALALPLVPVLWHRFVDPGTTAFMWRTARELRAGGRSGAVDHRWVPLERISPNMRLAAIAAEDQKFALHAGFDLEAIEKAFANNRKARERRGSTVRGASTITQQVAKNLYLWPGRSWLRKGLEAYLTVLIEACWPKRRILEVYLNVAQFDADLFGAEAAAQRFFRTSAARLTPAQAALLAAVLPNPVRYQVEAPSRYVAKRQRHILAQMRALGAPYLGELGR